MGPAILFLDVEQADQSLVLEHFPDSTFEMGNVQNEELVETCKHAAVISCFITTPFSRAVIEKLPKLKLLCTRSVGYDHIDLDACGERGIVVCNVPDYGSHVIAEHVFALLLSTLRHIREGEERTESGTFDYHGLRGIALKGKTIGILGTGKIGRKVATIAHGFEMSILATDQCRTLELENTYGVRYVSLEELLKQSDILTLHIPATKETTHLLDDKAFALMKDSAILVNTARGSLIDSQALLKALESGKIAHALLDVLEHEQNFEENKALIKHPKVVTTPHIAFYADDSMRNMYLDTFQSIEQWQKGETPFHSVQQHAVICDLPIIRR
jgi:D-lactate dehydrogenase